MIVSRKDKNPDDNFLPPEGVQFEVRVETDLAVVYKLIHKALQSYKDEKRGPTLLAIQSTTSINALCNNIPALSDFPQCQIHIQVSTNQEVLEFLSFSFHLRFCVF